MLVIAMENQLLIIQNDEFGYEVSINIHLFQRRFYIDMMYFI